MKRALAVLLGAALAAGVVSGEVKGRMTDDQAEALAKEAMASADPEFQRSALTRLQGYHFKSTLARQREVVLFAQGMLQDRMGDLARAAVTFHKLETGWPGSPFLPEAQIVMAQAALDHGRHKEAESRLTKALAAELPAESVRRAQELLLWCLADQGRAAEGAATVKALKPLGTAKPSERGLVGIMEALCAQGQRAEAEGTLADYRKLYPKGTYLPRMNLGWARLLGSTGDPKGAAKVFQKLIQDKPNTPEADEARMALATLLSDGSLPPKDAEGYPDAQALLARVKKTGTKEESTRKALMVNLRIALKEKHWVAALEAAAQFRAAHPTPGEAKPVTELRAEASRGFVQEALDKKEIAQLLPFLDAETLQALTPAQRLDLARALGAKGLPEAVRALAQASPAKEQPGLIKAGLGTVAPGAAPEGTLALLPAKGQGPQESLLRAQAAVSLRQWAEARAALGRARPGPERVQALLLYLTRPLAQDEKPEARAKEVEGWLARAPEKGEAREPLVLLAADRRAREGQWKEALALYPADPSAPNRGWVALMRATCQLKLGHTDQAAATLKAAQAAADFKAERERLGRRLGL
ncbi:tetratricopeptide repeat protein [Mesoterricola sediminis]|uniref:Tetratricopeptide repeat protein n=1 Tax=Mesoterricola sediminis TaxID=2927980 RepID=A0AA48GYV9_9BACT|nr:tetratricopeptide repeat protein [Mesoterricola sediminis]BDU76562.1 hypothetical protein METESE_15200 [Mesoterricola sediminis]